MDADIRPVTPEAQIVPVDVRMQLRTLLTRLMILQQTGSLTEEIGQIITSFASLIDKPVSNEVSSTIGPASDTPPVTLLTTVVYQARSGNVGTNWKHLVIQPGDYIYVYAYIDESTGVGFNKRTGCGGQFPLEIAEKIEPHPDVRAEIMASKYDCSGGNAPTVLAYKAGDYIRVCKWDKDLVWGYGFNQRTLTFGRFDSGRTFTMVD